MANRIFRFFGACVIASTFVFSALAYETKARSAYAIDLGTGFVILDKESDTALPPASMSKLMTVTLLFKALKDERIKLDTTFHVSQKAWEMAGSKMFLDINSDVSVQDLILGIVVQSGNDACVVTAEGLAGSEAEFAKLMNEYAAQIGLKNSSFANSSGWPDPNQRMSAHDLVLLAKHIYETYPEYWQYFSVKEFTYNNIHQQNRNPLFGVIEGADGLKTGHTEEAGYGLTGSVERNGRRVLFSLMGLETQEARTEEAKALVEWALNGLQSQTLAKAGDPLVMAPTWLGDRAEIALTTSQDIVTLVDLLEQRKAVVKVVYDGPIKAPLAEGSPVGRLILEVDGSKAFETPLVTAEPLNKGSFFSRYLETLWKLKDALTSGASDET